MTSAAGTRSTLDRFLGISRRGSSVRTEGIAAATPFMLVLTLMTFRFTITNGIGAGCISLAALEPLAGRAREIHPLLHLTSLGFAVPFTVV